MTRQAVTRQGESGAASVLAVGVIGACVALTLVLIPLYIGLTMKQVVANAADAAALAAADVAIGLLPGVPCDVAARAAELNRARLSACSVDGVIASVVVEGTVLGGALRVAARAGPPPYEPHRTPRDPRAPPVPAGRRPPDRD